MRALGAVVGEDVAHEVEDAGHHDPAAGPGPRRRHRPQAGHGTRDTWHATRDTRHPPGHGEPETGGQDVCLGSRRTRRDAARLMLLSAVLRLLPCA